MKSKILFLLLLIAVVGAAVYNWREKPSDTLILTGIVTEEGVVVSSQVAGQLKELNANEGDRVKQGQLLAVIEPKELKADQAYYAHSEEGFNDQVNEAEAAVRLQELQSRDQIRQAEAALAAAQSQQAEAVADLERVRLDFERTTALHQQGIVPAQANDQTRIAYDSAKVHVETLQKQVETQKAALALAHSNAEQLAVRQSQLLANRHQLAAASAQHQKAEVRLGYTEIRSPVDGIVDVRAASQGEVVNPAQPIVTLIDEDGYWVRADVPETYIDRIHLGDRLTVRLPSGMEREGTVYFRGVDASFATQRDVSRTKRDIKTFEIRLHVDNQDRSLGLGMTAYVLMPLKAETKP